MSTTNTYGSMKPNYKDTYFKRIKNMFKKKGN